MLCCVVLYTDSETWTVYRRHVRQLEKLHLRALRSVLGIRWQETVTNIEMLDRAKPVSIEVVLLRTQLRWSGHVIRMEINHIPKQLFFGELVQGHRNQGRPHKRYQDTLKDGLN